MGTIINGVPTEKAKIVYSNLGTIIVIASVTGAVGTLGNSTHGADALELAQEMIRKATTITELRQPQAVVLPLACGRTLHKTALNA